jgi:hypothetical protein
VPLGPRPHRRGQAMRNTSMAAAADIDAAPATTRREARQRLRAALAEWAAMQGEEPLGDRELEQALRAIDSRLDRAAANAATSNRARGLVAQLEQERRELIANTESFRLEWLRARDAASDAQAVLIEGAPKVRQDAVAVAKAARDEAARALEAAGNRQGWEVRTRLQWALTQAEDGLREATRAACEDDSET